MHAWRIGGHILRQLSQVRTSVSDAQALKALEDESRRLKSLLGNAMLDEAALKETLSKMHGPPRAPARRSSSEAEISERRAFSVGQVARKMVRCC